MAAKLRPLLAIVLGGLAAAGIALIPFRSAAAIGWGGVEPVVTTAEQVRERWGPPSKEVRGKEEGYDTLEWVYEGPSAPGGFVRMTVHFGLLRPDGYKPNLVRALLLEPRREVFPRQTVIDAFGVPDKTGYNKEGYPLLMYEEGLLVYFDKDGEVAILLQFSPPFAPPGSGGGGSGSAAPGPTPGASPPGRIPGAPAPAAPAPAAPAPAPSVPKQ